MIGTASPQKKKNEMMFTAEQVAKKLGVSRDTIMRWYRDGKLKGVRLGYRTVRFRSAEIEKMLERCE